jgi:hypothetical protein
MANTTPGCVVFIDKKYVEALGAAIDQFVLIDAHGNHTIWCEEAAQIGTFTGMSCAPGITSEIKNPVFVQVPSQFVLLVLTAKSGITGFTSSA